MNVVSYSFPLYPYKNCSKLIAHRIFGPLNVNMTSAKVFRISGAHCDWYKRHLLENPHKNHLNGTLWEHEYVFDRGLQGT